MYSYSGTTEKGNYFKLSKNISNHHILITGASGTGKTTEMRVILDNCIKHEGIAIVFDYHNTHIADNILPSYKNKVKRVNVNNDGIFLPLIPKQEEVVKQGIDEEVVIQRVTATISDALNLAPTYKNELYNAIEYVLHNDLFHLEGIRILQDWLYAQEKARSDVTATKLRPLSGRNLIKNGCFFETNKTIYVIDLNGLEFDIQILFVRFLMNYFIRLAFAGEFLNKPASIFLDEAQNIDFSEGTSLRMALNEGRKMNMSMILALPSIFDSSKKSLEVLTQCATKIFFKPLDKDRKKVAMMINPKKPGDFMFKLSQLPRGEAIVTGLFEIQDKEVDVPLHLKRQLERSS